MHEVARVGWMHGLKLRLPHWTSRDGCTYSGFVEIFTPARAVNYDEYFKLLPTGIIYALNTRLVTVRDVDSVRG